ncbi:MAG: FapA family protein [Candidatus Cloacimonetes bacterium]|jgi:uncharacterized protein (DUF342 family)|nr:FapA family protein [Candidatus Cloacimonadota bacterium]
MADVYESDSGIFSIEISDDKFTAYLTIKSGILPENNESFINENELIELIEKTNITFGFDNAQNYIEKNNIKKDFDQAFPLAIGKKSKDPEIEFSPLIDIKNCYNPSIENQFNLLNNLTRIKKDEPLAHLFITKKSESGINIYGEEVNPENYENQLIDQYLGENVSYSHERGQIIADKAGYPWMDDLSIIHVKTEFSIDNNLDLTYDDMYFFGNLIVNGDITDKIKLHIDGDLTVYGDINDANLTVTGNISVEGDIINCKTLGILAHNNITFNSAENSKIIAGNQINFKKNIHFCKITAENGIYGNEENSTIVGGTISSGEHIEVAIIGNTGGISSEIEISISPYTKESMLNISKKLMKLKELELETSEEYFQLKENLSNLEEKLDDEINLILKSQDNLPKHIMAFKKIFPGTYIRILKKSMHITDELNKVSFSIIDGELLSESY